MTIEEAFLTSSTAYCAGEATYTYLEENDPSWISTAEKISGLKGIINAITLCAEIFYVAHCLDPKHHLIDSFFETPPAFQALVVTPPVLGLTIFATFCVVAINSYFRNELIEKNIANLKSETNKDISVCNFSPFSHGIKQGVCVIRLILNIAALPYSAFPQLMIFKCLTLAYNLIKLAQRNWIEVEKTFEFPAITQLAKGDLTSNFPLDNLKKIKVSSYFLAAPSSGKNTSFYFCPKHIFSGQKILETVTDSSKAFLEKVQILKSIKSYSRQNNPFDPNSSYTIEYKPHYEVKIQENYLPKCPICSDNSLKSLEISVTDSFGVASSELTIIPQPLKEEGEIKKL